nr:hypothetical protein CFP56_76156 [Quercus suber]
MAVALFSKRAAARSSQCWSTTVRTFSTPVNDAAFSPTAPPPPPPEATSVLSDAVNATAPRYDWTRDEIRTLYNTPLMELAFQSVRFPAC